MTAAVAPASHADPSGWRTAGRHPLLTLRVALTLLWVEVALRILPLPRVARLAGAVFPAPDPCGARTTAPPGSDRRLSDREAAVSRLARGVAGRWPLASGPCLREALLTASCLRTLRPILRLGVRREGTSIRAHAWLEVDGEVVGDREGFRALVRAGGPA